MTLLTMTTCPGDSSTAQSNVADSGLASKLLLHHQDFSQINAPLLLSKECITHEPDSGLNPLLDAAAYLFSTLGKLKSLKNCSSLAQLQHVLLKDIAAFQETARACDYSPEYLIACRYFLCATFDDVISNMPWGNSWHDYSLLAAFNTETHQQNRFFIIIERIVKDPGLYIDLMECAYLCLILGYKGQYHSTEFNHHQLEQITHALYKHIRAYRGDFSKTLTPFNFKPVRATHPHRVKNPRLGLILGSLVLAGLALIPFAIYYFTLAIQPTF